GRCAPLSEANSRSARDKSAPRSFKRSRFADFSTVRMRPIDWLRMSAPNRASAIEAPVARLKKKQVSESDLDRSTGPYFLLSDPTLGCQRAAVPFWLGAAAMVLVFFFFGFLASRLPFCSR